MGTATYEAIKLHAKATGRNVVTKATIVMLIIIVVAIVGIIIAHKTGSPATKTVDIIGGITIALTSLALIGALILRVAAAPLTVTRELMPDIIQEPLANLDAAVTAAVADPTHALDIASEFAADVGVIAPAGEVDTVASTVVDVDAPNMEPTSMTTVSAPALKLPLSPPMPSSSVESEATNIDALLASEPEPEPQPVLYMYEDDNTPTYNPAVEAIAAPSFTAPKPITGNDDPWL